MEKYINKKNIVKDSIYEAFKDLILCPICKSIMIQPAICLYCQNKFCQKCKEKMTNNGENCPGNCDNPNITDVTAKNNFITKFKFKCIKGCGKEIPFNDIEKHYESDCLSKINKVRTLTPKEAAEYRKTHEEVIPHVTCKQNYKIIFGFSLVITLGNSHVGKSSLINT